MFTLKYPYEKYGFFILSLQGKSGIPEIQTNLLLDNRQGIFYTLGQVKLMYKTEAQR